MPLQGEGNTHPVYRPLQLLAPDCSSATPLQLLLGSLAPLSFCDGSMAPSPADWHLRLRPAPSGMDLESAAQPSPRLTVMSLSIWRLLGPDRFQQNSSQQQLHFLVNSSKVHVREKDRQYPCTNVCHYIPMRRLCSPFRHILFFSLIGTYPSPLLGPPVLFCVCVCVVIISGKCWSGTIRHTVLPVALLPSLSCCPNKSV